MLLYDAAARMLAELAGRRPLVVLLEDVHWADPPSLELLSYLAGHLAQVAVLLVVTFRDENVGEALAATLATLARELIGERLRLTGLDPGDAERTGDRDVDALAHHFWCAGPAVAPERALTAVRRGERRRPRAGH